MFFKWRALMLIWAGSLAADAYSLGQYAQGGVIFFLTPDMGHGFVAAITDQDGGAGVPWGPNMILTDACLDGIFFGEDYDTTAGSLNTDQMLLFDGADAEAAKVCKDYSVTLGDETYNDWFLPTIAEMRIMIKRRNVIDTTALANGGTAFELTDYWSSLENINSAQWAVTLSFDPTMPGTNTKDKATLCRVRAIRAF